MELKMRFRTKKSLCHRSTERILLALRLLVLLPSLQVAGVLGVGLLMYGGQWSVGKLLMHCVAGVTYAVGPILPSSVYSHRSCLYAVLVCCALVLMYAHSIIPSDINAYEADRMRLWASVPLVVVMFSAVLYAREASKRA